MLTDGRTTDGRTDDGVTGILIAHLGAFGSGELKSRIDAKEKEIVCRKTEFSHIMSKPVLQFKCQSFRYNYQSFFGLFD